MHVGASASFCFAQHLVLARRHEPTAIDELLVSARRHEPTAVRKTTVLSQSSQEMATE